MQDTLTATPERIRHARGTYEAPETNQTTKRDYGRIRAWYETLILKGSLPDELATTARDVSMYWHATNDPTGTVCSYGDQRWNGTPVGQVNAPALLGPEWRETARRRLMMAKLSVTKPRDWDYLCTAIEHNAGLTEVATICAAHRETVSAGLKRALTEIAREWGYLQQYRPPPRQRSNSRRKKAGAA